MKTRKDGKMDLYCTSSTSPPEKAKEALFSEALLKRAMAVWQPRVKEPLKPEEVEEALRNLVGFGQALLEAREVSNPPKEKKP